MIAPAPHLYQALAPAASPGLQCGGGGQHVTSAAHSLAARARDRRDQRAEIRFDTDLEHRRQGGERFFRLQTWVSPASA